MRWVTKARGPDPQPAEAQRFCLAVGIMLRDLTLMSNVAAGSTSASGMPADFAMSKLDPGRRAEILYACSSAFITGERDVVALPESRQKGKGKAKAKAAVVVGQAKEGLPAPRLEASAAAENSSGAADEGQTPAKRRSTRSSARRQ